MSALMTDAFDPYHRWLGIRDKQRPVNHYRLLGLEPLETDAEVIREAATRQLTYLQAHRNTAHRDLCLQLMEEVTDAKLALLDPAAKAKYDQQLRGGKRSPEPAAVGTMAASGRSGEPATCPQCNWGNRADREFCGGCGASLWEPCLGCGALAGAWEKFCGACGVQLAAMLQDRVAELAQQEQHVQRLLRQHRLIEAQPALGQLAAQSHPRLRQLADRARRALEQVETKLAGFEAARVQAVSQAREAIAAGDDDRAAELLRSIHPAVQTTNIRELLDQVEERRGEVAALTAEIRTAVQERRTSGLLPKVDRLLKLRPGLESALKLREKLLASREQAEQQRAVEHAKAARELAVRHDFAAAVEQLEKIAPAARTEVIAKLLEQCVVRRDEVAALAELLSRRTSGHESYLPLAERLLKLRPQDAQAHAWCAALKQPASREPRPRPSQGLPLGPLAGFRRLAGEANDSAEFQSQCGRFGVALGLALQGIGQAAIGVNLAPREQPKRLSLFGRSTPRTTAESAWGIDLGRFALKAVRLHYDAAADRAIVDSPVLIEHAPAPSDAPPDAVQQLTSSLQQFLERSGADPRNDLFCVNLPSAEVLMRGVRLPPVAAGKIAELIRYEAAQQIPFPLEHVMWDYQTTPGSEQEDGEVSEHQITLFAIKSAVVTQQLAAFGEAGIPVQVLQSGSAALHNLIAFERAADFKSGRAVVSIDLGAETTEVVVSHAAGLWCRSIATGGEQFTRSLVRRLQLTHGQAEKLKRQPHRSERYSEVAAAWQPLLEGLTGELQRSLSYLASQVRDVKPGRLVYGGGGMNLLGMLETVEQFAAGVNAS
jgi:type IV pilus assembly protein PilM